VLKVFNFVGQFTPASHEFHDVFDALVGDRQVIANESFGVSRGDAELQHPRAAAVLVDEGWP
jgi:hypothetical protein